MADMFSMKDVQHRNDTGYWHTFFRLRHPSKPLPDIVVLSMAHLADEAFLSEVVDEQWCGDIALVEGFPHPSGILASIGRRILARRLKLSREGAGKKKQTDTGGWSRPTDDRPSEWCMSMPGWVKKDHPYEPVGVRFVNADMNRKELRDALRIIPLRYWVLAPFFVIYFFFATRRTSRTDLIDAFSDSEAITAEMENGPLDKFAKILLDGRDAKLTRIISEEALRPENSGKRISIRYGAAHVPAILKCCAELGYEIYARDRVLAIAHDPEAQSESPDPCYGRARERFHEMFIWVGENGGQAEVAAAAAAE